MSSDQAGAGAREDREDRPGDEDRPGEPACLLRRVCPACGAVAERDPPTVCPQCHAEMPAD